MLRGQRFEIDLDDEDGDDDTKHVPLQCAFVGDVLERKPAAPAPPRPPTLKNKTGFPEHRKRTVESRFKQQSVKKSTSIVPEAVQSDAASDVPHQAVSVARSAEGGKAKPWEEEEKERIDKENREKLSQMSAEEIEEERRELMNSLGPGLIERLLKRSNINSGSTESDLSNGALSPQVNIEQTLRPTPKSVSFAEPAGDTTTGDVAATVDHVPQTENNQHHPDMPDPLPHDTVHFPQPQQPPDLDPSSETFLQDLHTKYFPALPSDPDKLEWMQASNNAKNTYDPSASGIDPKDLRFSFRGELIPPSLAAQIPVSAGLHHHGDAPDAAGYTISELVHLGHSSFAPQRCIAFQTLGRLLYRLGKGEFGDSGEPGAGTVGAEDTFGALARGIWREVDKEKVVAMLVMESEGKGIDGGKHLSAKAYATEAVWLWQRGGGRSWKAE